jgi:hypothetical protein
MRTVKWTQVGNMGLVSNADEGMQRINQRVGFKKSLIRVRTWEMCGERATTIT